MMRNVAALIWDGTTPFELGALCEAFGLDRTADGVPALEFAVCSIRPGPVRTSLDLDVVVHHGIERAREADLIAVGGHSATPGQTPPEIVEALQDAVARGARVLSACSGAFALGDAGLLDGRRCTTHWIHAAALAEGFPLARVDPNVLYVDSDPIITSAGTAAALDACLHLYRSDFGTEVASQVARRMVVPPLREGGQAQFVRTPVPEVSARTLTPVIDWARRHLAGDLSVPTLARHAAMSPRTFARRFRDETGTTPHRWVLAERLHLAEHLLETTDAPVEEISRKVGFGPASVLRHHFVRSRHTTPSAYRATFRCDAGPARTGT